VIPAENHSDRAWVEVDLNAITANLKTVESIVGPDRHVMAVVKADAYGHGAGPVCDALAQACSSVEFGVATADEALELRPFIPHSRIHVLSPILPCMADTLIASDAVAVLSDARSATALADAAERMGKTVSVHIEVDTGMGRNGALPEEAVHLAEHVGNSCSTLRLDGFMTHFANAEGDPELSAEQLRRFLLAMDEIRQRGVSVGTQHASNTAGFIRYPEAWLDMIRPGLAIYGLLPQLPRRVDVPSLVPALSLRTRVLLVRNLPSGTGISYGSSYRLARDSRVAVLAIGYADGLPRQLSNAADVLIRGRRAPIIGTICMDVCMADVTDIPDARPGDIVTLIGTDGAERICAEDLAYAVGTTEHEITTRLGPRLPRHYESPRGHETSASVAAQEEGCTWRRKLRW